MLFPLLTAALAQSIEGPPPGANAWQVARALDHQDVLEEIRTDLKPLQRHHVPRAITGYAVGGALGGVLMWSGAVLATFGLLEENGWMIAGGTTLTLGGGGVMAAGIVNGTQHVVRYRRKKADLFRLENYYDSEFVEQIRQPKVSVNLRVTGMGLGLSGTF